MPKPNLGNEHFNAWLADAGYGHLSVGSIMYGICDNQAQYCVDKPNLRPKCPSCCMQFDDMLGLKIHLEVTFGSGSTAIPLVGGRGVVGESVHKGTTPKEKATNAETLVEMAHKETATNALTTETLVEMATEPQASHVKKQTENEPSASTAGQLIYKAAELTPAEVHACSILRNVSIFKKIGKIQIGSDQIMPTESNPTGHSDMLIRVPNTSTVVSATTANVSASTTSVPDVLVPTQSVKKVLSGPLSTGGSTTSVDTGSAKSVDSVKTVDTTSIVVSAIQITESPGEVIITTRPTVNIQPNDSYESTESEDLYAPVPPSIVTGKNVESDGKFIFIFINHSLTPIFLNDSFLQICHIYAHSTIVPDLGCSLDLRLEDARTMPRVESQRQLFTPTSDSEALHIDLDSADDDGGDA